MAAKAVAPTPEQVKARDRWQARSSLPILVAAVIPLFVTSPKTRWIQVLVGLGSWLVFLIDLIVQRRIDPAYLRRRNGRIDLGIVVITFPYYLISGLSGASAILLLARLARVVRVFLATGKLRRFAARLGKVTIIAAFIVVVASLGAYQAEHPTNSEFATVGDAFWWGIVTLTTVGYGDIVPNTTAGRFCGVAIMITGVAVLGVLAGSLASLFNIEPGSAKEERADDSAAPSEATLSVPAELALLQAQLQEVEHRLGQLAQLVSGRGGDPKA